MTDKLKWTSTDDYPYIHYEAYGRGMRITRVAKGKYLLYVGKEYKPDHFSFIKYHSEYSRLRDAKAAAERVR
jgi:hypothetical protein